MGKQAGVQDKDEGHRKAQPSGARRAACEAAGLVSARRIGRSGHGGARCEQAPTRPPANRMRRLARPARHDAPASATAVDAGSTLRSVALKSRRPKATRP